MSIPIKATIALIFLCGVVGRNVNDNDPTDLVLSIKNGKIKGRKHKTVGMETNYYAFKGIPFAQPPIKNLRFSPPTPASNWDGIKDTIEDAPCCVFRSGSTVEGSEDCLYANVYVPQFPGSDAPLSVMVWIYGGAFQQGCGNYSNYGPDYFLDHDVIVVTFNYRVGILGFLSTGDLVVPGNNGLKDQVMALEWFKENVKYFGGAPEKVTVFGESAGSASVSYLLQSKLTQGLFQRAIMESGVSLSLWTLSRHNVEISYATGKSLNISTNNSQVLLEELRKIPAPLLVVTASTVSNKKYLVYSPREGLFFSPVLEPEHENAVITGKTHAELIKGNFQQVPMIVGFNSLEGSAPISALIRLYLLQYDSKPSKLVPIDMNIKKFYIKDMAGKEIKQEYFNMVPIAASNTAIMNFIGDDSFVRPIREYVRLVSKFAPVYYYEFGYEGELSGVQNRPGPGVSHAEELNYFWRNSHSASDHDKVVRSRVLKLWTNFAKYGNPTPFKDSLLNTNWTIATNFSNSDLSYLHIGRNLEMRINPNDEKMKFWDNLYKKFGKPPYDTY